MQHIVIQMHVQMRVQLHPPNGNKQTPRDDNQREEFNSHKNLILISREVLLESLSRVVYVFIVVVGYGKDYIYEETDDERKEKKIN